MHLKISKKKNVYYLKGRIIGPNVKLFLNFFIKKINKGKNVMINIDKAIEIDKSGLDAMQQLMRLSLTKEKDFSIIGEGCKEIYDHFYAVQLN
jgi:hypothetical protein